MAKKARMVIGTPTLTAIADRDYFKGEEILACHEAGIFAVVPPTKTSGAKADGRFDKADFIYDPQKDEYRYPAGQALNWRFASVEKGVTNHRYWSSNCKECPLKEKCTPGAQRRVTRWEHQDVLDDMLARLEQSPNAMRIRRSTVEHPYGTLQAWMGSTHFLTNAPACARHALQLALLVHPSSQVLVSRFYTAWTGCRLPGMPGHASFTRAGCSACALVRRSASVRDGAGRARPSRAWG
jgi:hypothetical protein